MRTEPMHRRYLVCVDGRYRHTHYTPTQTAEVRRRRAAGETLDSISAALDIPYSSLAYVAAMEHCSRVVPAADEEPP